MIAVDTSALMAIVLSEPQADRCIAALEADDRRLISAGTVVEALIVGAGRGISEDINHLLAWYGSQIIPVDGATAPRIERIYRIWGKGFHKAALNFGDCFAYDVAQEYGCPLLYVGNDFAVTDIASAI